MPLRTVDVGVFGHKLAIIDTLELVLSRLELRRSILELNLRVLGVDASIVGHLQLVLVQLIVIGEVELLCGERHDCRIILLYHVHERVVL